MEGPNTVDVSWLHHSHRADQLLRTKSATSSIHENSSGVANAKPEPSGSVDETSPQNDPDHHQPKGDSLQVPNGTTKSESSSHNERSTPAKKAAESPSTLVVTPRTAPKVVPGRRNSWISSLSSKFSTGTTPPGQNTVLHVAPKPSPPVKPDINPFGASFSPKDKDERLSDSSNTFASASSSPKNPSFLSHAFRKFSSGTGGMAKSANNGGVCQRRIMNVDPNRDRCKVPELSQGKLKRVAFCVDVEIAGFASRADDEVTRREPTNIPTSQASKLKSKEKGEAGPLKTPDGSGGLEKTQDQNPPENDRSAPSGAAGSDAAAAAAAVAADNSAKEPTKKQEKKKRSEEERKERKERKRRQAEENGTIPMQFRPGEEEQSGASSTAVPTGSRKTQSHPTTDPVRIYRRCCQLRETPVLKKLVEQMTSPSSTLVEAPGTVAVLDLTDFPMTLQDIMTLSDWLAIVPVRKLILENCVLTDEGLRSILAGLLSTKTMQQARNRRRSTKENLASAPPLFGAVEKLSLKDNTKIGPEGWRHICLFIHLSKSLKAIDLSGIPFPKRVGEGVASPLKSRDLAATLASSMTTRFGGDYLEELLLSECRPSTEDIEKICDAAAAIKLRRLGLANNDITHDGLEHIVRYIRCGHCEGIDLGGNNLHESSLSLLSNAFDSQNPLIALSLADCSLTPATIFPLLQACPILPNFRFIDFSHNPALFTSQPDCLSMLRKFLPRMSALKRIHLADVDLSPDHAIALAEVLPECPSLAHFNILENPRIAKLGSSSDPADQEEACAVYASLMAAARVSRTLIAVDIEVPGAESNEVVRALASQIVAYSLRNLGALEELSDSSQVSRSEVPIPEVLQHLVGHNGPVVAPTEDEPTPNEDYVIGGTGVVKALGVCLGNLDRQQAETGSGRSTPVQHIESPITKTKKARDMSKNLLGSARNIQARLQVALVREDRAGNDDNYRRLQFLDQTLQKIIQRFEEEFPECRVSADDETEETLSQRSSEASQDHAVTADVSSAYVPDATAAEEEEADPFAIRLSRRGSNTSLHSRALTSEEGRLHRISQNIRRDFLNPSLIAPEDGGAVSGDDSHINAIREKLENLKDDEKMGTHVESVGADKAFHELGSTVEELWIIQQQDSDAFERWKESQIAAQINAGLRPAPGHDAGQSSTSQTGPDQR